MAATVSGVLLTGVHGSRPASGVSTGTLYSCTTHSLVYQTSDTGSTWATWASLAGTGLTNPMTSVGDIIQGTTAGAPASLAAPLAGKVLTGAGVTTSVAYAYPPGYELSYVERTTNLTVTATTEATSNTLVTAAAVTYDGAAVMIEAFAVGWTPKVQAAADMSLILWDDTAAASIGQMAYAVSETAAQDYKPVLARRRLTPAAGSRTYSIRAYVSVANGTILGGAGGVGAAMPAYIRITKV